MTYLKNYKHQSDKYFLSHILRYEAIKYQFLYTLLFFTLQHMIG